MTQRTTVLARFPIRLNLPGGQQQFVEDAAEAVRKEYRSSVRWKRLRCRKVESLTGQPGENIFILEIGHSIEFDWTWEGAVAFRPADPNAFSGDIDTTDDLVDLASSDGATNGQQAVWAGEIVEVDETNGRLFVSVSGNSRPPCTGTFFVRPFEFLAFLHAVFCHSSGTDFKKLLAPRLNACCGGIHPTVAGTLTSSMEELRQLWGHSWAILWGPPGTGKTHTLGRQVAGLLNDRTERILVISTTNRATDAAAIAIGRAATTSPHSPADGTILRLGKGADWAHYQAHGLEGLLRGTETGILHQLGALNRQLEKAKTNEDRAILRDQIKELRRSMKDSAFNIFVCPDVQIVIGTAFKATTLLNDPSIRAMVCSGESPFTTLVIDEAGLMSRAVVAALSLLASRRVLVVGDAKQLAPISKVSRILPTAQAIWLASSCLSHLQSIEQVKPGVHLLREQHRMHPDVSRVVSHFQYDGALRDAPSVLNRQADIAPLLDGQPRAIWYVLDEDSQDLPSIRAERGPGNRSWIRRSTQEVLAKLFSHTGISKAKGLFITPFRAQARDISSYFAKEKFDDWSAGTVHSRQGTEADAVIFDTVNAGSTGWSYDEWKRLVNVGLSRAREFVIVLASRAEMNEPYLCALLDTLAPRILKRANRSMVWTEVSARSTFEVPLPIAINPSLLGNQLAQRKILRPVMSKEQQQLCGREMDGKPRLVRGVAGSGKTLVLAHWLQKTVQKLSDKPDARVWAVFANKALERHIADTILEAWKIDCPTTQFPWHRVDLKRVDELLGKLLQEVGLPMQGFDYDRFDYDRLAANYLERLPFEQIKSCCQAMFIDEAQDMGPSLIKLLSAFVETNDPNDPNSRAVNIFYDNAQNIYGRSTPKWKDIGLDIQGRRSTIMKESFRSTRPIAEFALNVLYRLQPSNADPDHKELVKQGLIECMQRNGKPWWDVRFNQVEGPTPIFKKYPSHEKQVHAVADQVLRWIREEGTKPGDICILCNDKQFRDQIREALAPGLREINAKIVSDPGKGWDRDERSVVASTLHSFKGYDCEIVVVAGLERFIGKGQILANNLYVAMSRARSILAVYAYARPKPNEQTRKLLTTLEECLNELVLRPKVEKVVSNLEDFQDVLERLGLEHRDWLATIWESHKPVQQEPITASDGEILAEPLFWFQLDQRRVACFGNQQPGAFALHTMEDNGIEVIRPGQELPSAAA